MDGIFYKVEWVTVLTKVFLNIFKFIGETVISGANFISPIYEAFNEVCFTYFGYKTIVFKTKSGKSWFTVKIG